MKLYIDPFSIIVLIAILITAGAYMQADKKVVPPSELQKEGK